ncbi:MAG: single-stranded DNA-binding protein [Methylobacter sp.]|nr:single-stranded DNA-binding protein [Methylobacter sp.]MDP2429951.1 single-stranded DNA-binding protein [Methylobacter sp.]MDP3054796.1 single-stranded DNA-binding protein [Methylobacter sp.]MDP3361220.1 single-stranded DNA-binding protein [Methylobacter sp.]MDZ4218653.1 single-stranded DNA-binding protein [Methylobacter sp.]
MIEALVSGKMIKDAELKTGAKSTYCNFLVSVDINEPDRAVVSCIAFNEAAERIAKLKKGDAVTVIGALKPSQWTDKATGQTKHGLNVTVSSCLSVYDLKQRKASGSHE